jgi:phi13 family phage major tail protein
MAAVGKVTIGFSKPYVAKYTVSQGTVTYTDCQRMARGVSVVVSPESSDNNNFYADNIVAETDSGAFTGGTVTYTVDGLLQDAEALIQGLPAADADGFLNYDDDQATPYLGTGFIIEYMSEGVRYWTPVIFTKVIAGQIETNAETEGESIDWQTQEIPFTLFKDDSAKHCWKRVGGEMASEAAAEAALVAALGG